ncbi:hypothetical protein SARC_08928 [Sphaeroforma arctica JP610]|uniref:Uncharacterized protein n=1 Tax=Sphaeroforma arctica JP610 TaxID=667725 RepID=A0A0L0FPB2_9EUKA|nr:hypothetical protein SARC_08928 [Sphaeroforma arctica JP610]KNC78645.1 hypothetical protein SARC_08928 [Sphaeroforma arctica JP610]|eukprot:XP_014152547.1 hypothetical protein SARC_08928 [Sphaeroforma arctica JP610]
MCIGTSDTKLLCKSLATSSRQISSHAQCGELTRTHSSRVHISMRSFSLVEYVLCIFIFINLAGIAPVSAGIAPQHHKQVHGLDANVEHPLRQRRSEDAAPSQFTPFATVQGSTTQSIVVERVDTLSVVEQEQTTTQTSTVPQTIVAISVAQEQTATQTSTVAQTVVAQQSATDEVKISSTTVGVQSSATGASNGSAIPIPLGQVLSTSTVAPSPKPLTYDYVEDEYAVVCKVCAYDVRM